MLNRREYAGEWILMPSHRTLPVSGVARARSFWREAWRACGLYERATLGYLGFTAVLFVLFQSHLAGWWKYLLVHAALGAAMLIFVATANRSANPVLAFARAWYPFAFFIFFFEELHFIVRLIVPQWLDAWLLRFDYALLGVHPTVWLQQFASPAVNDTMQFFYMTYYFFTVVLCALLYAKREERSYWNVINATAIAYTIGYIIALLLPMEGPYHTLRALHTVELRGGVFTSVIGIVQKIGRVHGAAFPSLHVAGAFVAVLGAWRFRRWLFWVYLPLFIGMMISTVYGRYHYFADIPGGLILGAVGWAAVSKREAKLNRPLAIALPKT